jgi:predicted DNA-binding protein with PD1-like motif
VRVNESSRGYIVVLEPGEELVRSLTAFARQYDVDSAILTGFGAVAELELAASVGRITERRINFRGPLEVCALQGTIGLLDGEPFPHVHGSFSRADCTTVGGHVCEAVCASMLEIIVQPWEQTLLLNSTRQCGFREKPVEA